MVFTSVVWASYIAHQYTVFATFWSLDWYRRLWIWFKWLKLYIKDSFEREYILNLDMIIIMCLRFYNEESLWGMYWSILPEPQFIPASRGLRESQYFNFYFQNYIHVPLWLSHPESREHSRTINQVRHCAIAFRGRQSSWCWEWVKVSWQQARQAGLASTAQLQSSDRLDQQSAGE